MRTRNESAAMRTANAALRRDVDALDGRMKEDVANLKHECANMPWCLFKPFILVAESRWNWTTGRTKPRMTKSKWISPSRLVTRPAESHLRIDTRLQQEVHNKSLVSLGELRTMMEEVRWDNMRKSVGMCPMTISQ